MDDPLERIDKIMGRDSAQRDAALDEPVQQNERKTRRKKAYKKMGWGLFWGLSGVFWLNYEMAQSRPYGFTVLMQLLLILVGALGIFIGGVQLYRAIDRGEVGFSFGLLWGLLSGIGLAVGITLAILVVIFIVVMSENPTVQAGYTLPYSVILQVTLIIILILAVVGAGPGTVQWLMLRKQISGAGWWIAATMLGFGLSIITFVPLEMGIASLKHAVGPDSLILSFLTGLGLGTVIGTAQWLVLRRHVSGAGWWVLASGLGYAGGLIGVSLNWNEVADLLLGWLAYGGITGLAIVWLLRRSFSEV